MTSTGVTRRRLLGAALVTCALGLPRPVRALAGAGPVDSSAALVRKLARFHRHPQSAAIVGRAYLRQVPEETDLAVLVDLICSGPGGGRRGLAAANLAGLHRTLRAHLRHDFATDQVVNLHGWILSRTEARLCALAALLT